MTTPATVKTSYRLIGPTEDGRFSNLLEALDSSASSLRLQALIAEWLRMENLVVLTGAGTSVSSGGKTMANLEKSVLSVVKATAGLSPEVWKIIETREKDVAAAEATAAAKAHATSPVPPTTIHPAHVASAPVVPPSTSVSPTATAVPPPPTFAAFAATAAPPPPPPPPAFASPTTASAPPPPGV